MRGIFSLVSASAFADVWVMPSSIVGSAVTHGDVVYVSNPKIPFPSSDALLLFANQDTAKAACAKLGKAYVDFDSARTFQDVVEFDDSEVVSIRTPNVVGGSPYIRFLKCK